MHSMRSPVAVFWLARRMLSLRWAFTAAALILTQATFGQELPAIARQEIALMLFVALAAMSGKPAALEHSEPIADPVPAALAQTEAPAPQLRQQPTETAEVVAALPDAEASELALAPPAVAPRMLGDAHPAYSDPAQDISTVVSAAVSAKPAALEPSEPIEGPIPLPRRKPRVTFVHVSRAVSLARSPTVASSPRPTSRH